VPALKLIWSQRRSISSDTASGAAGRIWTAPAVFAACLSKYGDGEPGANETIFQSRRSWLETKLCLNEPLRKARLADTTARIDVDVVARIATAKITAARRLQHEYRKHCSRL
jgi:hypothetical protein